MEFSFKDLLYISVEEAYVFPPEGIHRTDYLLEINPNGSINESDFSEDTSTELTTDSTNVQKLFKDLLQFSLKIDGVEVTIDDTVRNVILHFENYVDLSIPLYAKNKDGKYVSDLIDEFKNNCKVSEGEK